MQHVQRFQSMKHFDFKRKLQLFPSRSELLFSYFEASVKQYCLRRLQKQAKAIVVHGRHYTETHTCLSELSAIIWIIRLYKSVLCTYTQHCRKAASNYSSFWWWARKIRQNHFDATAVACLSPCTLAQSSFQQNKNVNLLFWAGSTFLGLNMQHMLTRKICSIDTR